MKGSGGDLGSIKRTGFATLYQEKLLALERSYKGVETEDDMVEMYPLCAFRNNPVAASIDTPLHGFLPFPHVDHLHPDWGIALAASANGKAKMEEFNREFDHSLVWIPWQRPGFELAMMMKRAVSDNPGCDGIVLGGHGLFTWGETQRECYLNTLTVIDQIGQFIARHGERKGTTRFGGESVPARADRQALAVEIAALSARAHQHAASLDRQLQRCARRAAVCELGARRGACLSRNQLPRSLYPHQDSAACLCRGRRLAASPTLKAQIESIAGGVSQAVSDLLPDVCHTRLTGAARRQALPSF